MIERFVCGVLGVHPQAKQILIAWNTWGRTQTPEWVCVRYPTTDTLLPERFSEMFCYDRVFYFVSPKLSAEVTPFLDVLHTSDLVNCIYNHNGVLYGCRLTDAQLCTPAATLEYCKSLV